MQKLIEALKLLGDYSINEQGTLKLLDVFPAYAAANEKAEQILKLAFTLKIRIDGVEVPYKRGRMTFSAYFPYTAPVRSNEGQQR